MMDGIMIPRFRPDGSIGAALSTTPQSSKPSNLNLSLDRTGRGGGGAGQSMARRRDGCLWLSIQDGNATMEFGWRPRRRLTP